MCLTILKVLSTCITYYDDRGYSGSDADWRGSRGRCTSSYCSAVVTVDVLQIALETHLV